MTSMCAGGARRDMGAAPRRRTAPAAHLARIEAAIVAVRAHRLKGDAAALLFYVAHRSGTPEGCYADVERMASDLGWSAARVKRARSVLRGSGAVEYRRAGRAPAVWYFDGSTGEPTSAGDGPLPDGSRGEPANAQTSAVVGSTGEPATPALEAPDGSTGEPRAGSTGEPSQQGRNQNGQADPSMDDLVAEVMGSLRATGRDVAETPVRRAIAARPERETALAVAGRLAEQAMTDADGELRSLAALFEYRLGEADASPHGGPWPSSDVEPGRLRTAWAMAAMDVDLDVAGARPRSLAAGVLFVTAPHRSLWAAVEAEAVDVLRSEGFKIEQVEVVADEHADRT